MFHRIIFISLIVRSPSRNFYRYTGRARGKLFSVLAKKQKCKGDKLKYKKLEVIKPRIKSKSELPTREKIIQDQSK